MPFTVVAGVLLASVRPAVASTSGKETVAVVPLEASARGRAATVERRLETWVAGDPRFIFVDLGAAARRPGVHRAAKAAVDLKAGLAAYDTMQYQQALALLDKAANLYQRSDLAHHLDGLLDVYAARALALYYAGRVADARNQLTDLFTLAPTYTLPASRMTPEVAKLASQIRGTVRGTDPTSLEIHSDPVPAQVYVDGHYAGVTPVVVPNLIAGHHFVAARADGYAVAYTQGLAAPGQIVTLHLDPAARGPRLHTLERDLAAGLDSRNPSGPAAAIARFAHAASVLVVGVSTSDTGSVHLIGVRVAADRHILAYSETNLPSSGSGPAIDVFAGRLHAHDRPRGPGGRPITALSPAGHGLGMRGWGYVTGGTGAVALAAGIAIGLTASATGAKARAVPQADNATYQKLMGQARGEALTANVLYGVGAVGIGVGLYLMFAGGHSAPASSDSSVFSLAPAVVPGGFAVAVAGRF